MIIPHTCKPGPCPLCAHNAKQGLVSKQEVGTSSGCCGTTYWCVDGVPVGVEADGLGVYYPPEGATGDPYPTFEDALEFGCPPQDIYAECDGFEFIHPGNVMLSLVNATGVYQNGSKWAEFIYPIGYPHADHERPCSVYYNAPTGNSVYCALTTFFEMTNGLRLYWGYVSVPSGSPSYDGNLWQKLMFQTDTGPPCWGLVGPGMRFTGVNGWPDFSSPSFPNMTSTRTHSGTDGRFLVPTMVGTVEYLSGLDVLGTADVYIQGGG